MKHIGITTLILCFCFVASAQNDTTPRFHKVRVGLYSSLSYQMIVNPNAVETNMGDIAFKGRLNPSVGLGIRYQLDSIEFAIVTASAAFMDYSVSADNSLLADSTTYTLDHRYGIVTANYALEGSYHRRIGKISPNSQLNLECGAGIHVMHWSGGIYGCDSAVGNYSVNCTLKSKTGYFAIPSAQIGLDLSLKSPSHKTEYVIGLRSQLYLAKLNEIRYDLTYTSPTSSVGYYLHYAPVMFTPKVYVMVVF